MKHGAADTGHGDDDQKVHTHPKSSGSYGSRSKLQVVWEESL